MSDLKRRLRALELKVSGSSKAELPGATVGAVHYSADELLTLDIEGYPADWTPLAISHIQTHCFQLRRHLQDGLPIVTVLYPPGLPMIPAPGRLLRDPADTMPVRVDVNDLPAVYQIVFE